MNALLLISLLFGVAYGSDVIDFTDDDFKDNIGDHSLILVEFFAPWCGHCKKLAPEFETAATTLQRESPPIALAKVDCTANTQTCGAYGVSGYPTLKVFRNGEPSDYQGPRESAGIISFMKKQAGPKSVVIATEAQFDDFTSGATAAIVGFFADETSAGLKEFKKLTDAFFEEFRFAYTLDSGLAEKHSGTDKVVLFRPPQLASKFEESQAVFDGAIKKKDVEKFIRENVHGLCGYMTADNQAQFTKKPLLTAYYNVDYKLDKKGTNYWRNRVMNVGREFIGSVYLSIASASDFQRKLDDYDTSFDAEGGSPVVAIEGAKGEKFVMPEKFTVKTLKAFIQAFVNGELEPFIKSEDIPASNDGPVKVVVGKTFDEIVNDETKDVLIEFYAPWCGHCKTLEPKYNELGEALSGDNNIVIAKMDATANDVPPAFEVRGFPTLYWAPKNNKSSPKKYEGGREVPDFIKFIKKEATSKPVNTGDKTEL
ncbi:protein disulfide-isomerase A3 [Strongylocentrotus purpuratus]|uniref:Protein disulfide-isomerase n=1 Tax=Strongylocentrotus purpuratus TaxID=7668 RepID=A0A7M7N7R3_STRPU|nr:protein disulfide-isomerase A3 [Strongylocentrotus purpuratus]